jgi:hypothetical protein
MRIEHRESKNDETDGFGTAGGEFIRRKHQRW